MGKRKKTWNRITRDTATMIQQLANEGKTPMQMARATGRTKMAVNSLVRKIRLDPAYIDLLPNEPDPIIAERSSPQTEFRSIEAPDSSTKETLERYAAVKAILGTNLGAEAKVRAITAITE